MDVHWIKQAGVEQVAAGAVRAVLALDDGVVWVDLDHTEEEGMRMLTDLFAARPSDLQECHARTPVPKLHAYADHYFSAINGLARGTDERLYFQAVKIFFGARLLVTVFGPASSALTAEASHRDLTTIKRQVTAGALQPRSAFDLVTSIRFEMLQTQEQLVTLAADRVAELERNVMQCDPVTAEALLEDLFGVRHDLQMIRTNAAQTHELYVHLIETLQSRDELMRLDLRRLNDLRQGYSHLRNTTDLEREYLQEVLDLFQTRVSTELNRFVRKITAFGTIGIAWTVLVGIYGMNFSTMPELDWRFGYPSVLLLMAVVGAVLVILFRRQRWL